jgi:D-alanyl-D-alanine carboxypeptidase/D-alanyl-D-alanine-endopeptidase (penicillin-binding protein 4)
VTDNFNCRILVVQRTFFILLVLFLTAFPAFIAPVTSGTNGAGSPLTAVAEKQVVNGGFAVQKNGRYIATHNLHHDFIPASIIKIATALEALDVLGPEYRFATYFYRDTHDNLYIKGFGDPFLISEEVAAIVTQLKEHGCTKINDIYLDDSAFQLDTPADGAGRSDNPYDVRNSALAVNFNTVNIVKDKSGRVAAAEEQTPTLPLMAELAARVQPGIHRINITSGDTVAAEYISRYAGELFRAFQKRENMSGHGIISRKKVPRYLAPFYVHHSGKTLEAVIGPLMQYSNNFIANQIFLAAGAAQFGYPATWEKGRRAMAGYLQQKKLSPAEIQIFEGSGISRKNRVSPGTMMQLLDYFKPFAGRLPQKDGGLMKSGTLTGVYCYAGYFTDNGRLDSFVLMLNQAENNRDGLLQELQKIYLAN